MFHSVPYNLIVKPNNLIAINNHRYLIHLYYRHDQQKQFVQRMIRFPRGSEQSWHALIIHFLTELVTKTFRVRLQLTSIPTESDHNNSKKINCYVDTLIHQVDYNHYIIHTNSQCRLRNIAINKITAQPPQTCPMAMANQSTAIKL